MPAFPIDVVVDLVCPWCFIGEARLRQALDDRPELEVAISVRPFLLDPSLPREGRDLREWLTRRYGQAPSGMFARVEQAAQESGLPLDFAKITRVPNTLSAHVVVSAAAAKGTQLALTRALFDAYFLEGLDIARTDVIASIASKHGFDRDEVAMLVDDEAARDAIRAEAQTIGRQGVSGVPFFVFGGTHAISGAHPKENLLKAIDAALAAPPAATVSP